MGRIAEALKKAQRERDEQLNLGIGTMDGPKTAAPRGLSGIDGSLASAAVHGGIRADAVHAFDPAPTVIPESRIHSGKSWADTFTPLNAGLRDTAEAPGPVSDNTTPVEVPPHRIGRRPGDSIHPLPAWDVDPQLVAVTDRSSSVVEQYRAVRTWMLSHNTMGEHNCIAVTSSNSQEGKTVTTANLSVILSEVRHLNVLAVDADIRRGSLAKVFRIPNGPGLADVLSARCRLDEAIAQTPIGNLSFLPASKSMQLNPTELFNTRAAGLLFDEIRERFHYVLVDTPPVQSFSDVGVVGALCTGILMVVRMHKTPSSLVRQSVQWLQANNLKVIGCIASATNQKGGRVVYDYEKD